MTIEIKATKDDIQRIHELFEEYEELDTLDEAVEMFLDEHELVNYLLDEYSCFIMPYSYEYILKDKTIALITITR